MTHHFFEVSKDGHVGVVGAVVEPDGTGSASVGGAQGRLDAAVVAGRHRSRQLVHRSPDLLVLLGHLGRVWFGRNSGPWMKHKSGQVKYRKNRFRNRFRVESRLVLIYSRKN